MSIDPQTALKDKNRTVGLAVLGVVCVMGGLAYASVPLYALFCRVTGYGGTPQVAEALPDRILDRAVTVRFDSNVSDTLDWDFKPELKTVKVRLGERGVIAYLARNNSGAAETGTAVYNVSPPKAGPYFNKIQCFCFGEQVLQAGEEAHMPVLFYIDPAMDDDPNLKDVKEITLSYTFFKTESSALEEAMEAFYNFPMLTSAKWKMAKTTTSGTGASTLMSHGRAFPRICVTQKRLTDSQPWLV